MLVGVLRQAAATIETLVHENDKLRHGLAPGGHQTLKELRFSVRTRRALQFGSPNRPDGSITTLGHLVTKTADELLEYRGFGDLCLAEVREILAAKGLALAGETTVDPASPKG